MALEFYRFAVALGIGLLVGIQRETAYDDPEKRIFAGVRTFALISLAGYTTALVSTQVESALPYAAMLLVLGVLMGLSYYADLNSGKPGLTTKVSVLIVFAIGAMCYWDYILLAAALGVSLTVLLSLKHEFRMFTLAITKEDVYATLTFAVISLVVLPVLPNTTYGLPPLDILNVHKIWLMVVFTSGISFLGYIMMKIIGVRRGITLTGLLGGVASSTAVTMSFSQRSRHYDDLARPFSLAIIIAWTVMFIRVLVVVFALDRTMVQQLYMPIGMVTASAIGYCIFLFLHQDKGATDDLRFVNPFELGPALKFGAVFAVVLVVARAAQLSFGNIGVYISSFISGLVDVDAIAFTMVDLVSGSTQLDPTVGSRAIVIAALSNTLFKGAFALINGSRKLRRALFPGLLLILGVGVVAIWTMM